MDSLITLKPLILLTAVSTYLIARNNTLNPLITIFLAELTFIPLYIFLYLGWLYPFYISPLRHVPTVPGNPLWGNVRFVFKSEMGLPHRVWHEQYGPIIRYFFLFGNERLSIADDEALKHVLSRNAYNYTKPVRAKLWMDRILGNGLLLAEGEDHIQQRKALAPGFSISAIRALTPVFWEKSLLMAQHWQKELDDSGVTTKSIETLPWLNRCTLDIIGKGAFGYDIDSLNNPDAPLRQAYLLVFGFDFKSRIFHALRAFLRSAKYLPFKANHDLETSRRIIIDKATEIIHAKEADAEENDAGKDIIALIARSNRKSLEAGEQGLSFETMRDQIMTFLGAGHDTTAAAVSWALHLLSKNPEIQSRLREEIRQTMPFLFNPETRLDTTKLAAADPDQLPYLDNVCRESLRYIPPVPFTVRQAIKDDVIDGYPVPAGMTIYIIPNAINHLSLFWGPNPSQFDPDRWDNLPAEWTQYAYMSFLQGTRGCIGRKFAETEMKVLLCCVLSVYDFKPDENYPDPEVQKRWRLVLRPKDGMHLHVSSIAPSL